MQGQTPIWYQNEAGGLTPGWNIAGAIVALLGSNVAALINDPLDRHGREPAGAALMRRLGLDGEPILNIYIAMLAAAVLSVDDSRQDISSASGFVLPPIVHLSHDCDNIRGNSVWQQGARLRKTLRELAQSRHLDMAPVRSGLQAMRAPDRHFFQDIADFAVMEQQHDFFSRFYFLVGPRGRFDSRASLARTRRAVRLVPQSHGVGLHYGYSTLGAIESLRNEQAQLERFSGRPVITGRAHYLRLDPTSSLQDWARAGIRFDESVGYSDRPGFRVGLAGCYRPLGSQSRMPLDLVECPLYLMDGAVTNPDEAICDLTRTLDLLTQIGGSISLLFHTGVLTNPEFPDLMGLYPRILDVLSSFGCRQVELGPLLESFGVDRLNDSQGGR